MAVANASKRLKTGKLKVKLVNISELEKHTLESMWAIFCRYYTDVNKERFLTDLKNKDSVFLLHDRQQGKLQGFSTIKVFKNQIADKPYVAIYSGDTIINHQYWGQTALQRGFFNFIIKTKLMNLNTDVYWFLISKGYKTYLLLSRNFPNYWPCHNKDTPNFESNVLDQLATDLFSDSWKPEKGILSFDSPMGKLKAGVAPIDQSMLANEDISFFLDKNSGHAKGDELCCLGKVDYQLAQSYPKKLLSKALRKITKKIDLLWPVQS